MINKQNKQLTRIVLSVIVIASASVVPVSADLENQILLSGEKAFGDLGNQILRSGDKIFGDWGSQTLRSGEDKKEVLKFAQFCINNWRFYDHDAKGLKATAGIQPETSYGYVLHNSQESIKKSPNYYWCGDCDDFAVMLAYKIKQFFPNIVDTKVAVYYIPSGGHAVCLIGIDPLSLGIGYQIYYNGKTWSAIDMKDNGGIYRINPDYARAPPSKVYNPKELIGNTAL